MENDVISKRMLIFIGLASFVVIVLFYILPKINYTTVVFCNVGQGDGVYIRTAMGEDIVIDAGPTKDMLLCLGKYMPFNDHTIEYAILSHAHLDHYGGFQEIIGRYKIKLFIYSLIPRQDQNFNMLTNKIKSSGARMMQINSTDVLKVDSETQIEFIWPTQQFISGFDEAKGDLNDTSAAGIFTYNNFDILFTGDISPESIEAILKQRNLNLAHIEVLKVPHHGSKNGLTQDLLHRINPYISIASVGIRNKFGHPSPEIIDLFKQTQRTFLTTAEKGDIVIRVIGEKWYMNTNPP